MGVTGLWTVVQPCARPIKIETLNKKRLAVDASIWIYQFLKAVRDKEGNALRNSHVVGFFRRICKLLFIGIKPVFVFDGGAPILKRQTISARKSRREGRREDAVRTAGKLLAVQMQRRAEDEERRRKEGRDKPADDKDEPLPENLVYVDEVLMSEKERQQNRRFKKKDAYHLPDLDASLAEMGGPDDPRIMSLEELEMYARQFDTGEDINVYDFSKIDFDGIFFTSLPATDRYNILNAARLRSRLRMGYSKDQLDTMFPDRMAFSKFQIERVKERNELTQRLMHVSGMVDDGTFGGPGRVIGEKGREYVLVRNDGVEGGWALGVVSKDEGEKSKPIDVDQLDKPASDEEDDNQQDDDFEDVPIEGLNRLKKKKQQSARNETENHAAREFARLRRNFYHSRKQQVSIHSKSNDPANQDVDSLFITEGEDDQEWEDVLGAGSNRYAEAGDDEEAADLQRAIAMSLENDKDMANDGDDDDFQEVFGQNNVEKAIPFSSGSGIAVARMANNRSSKAAMSRPFAEGDSEDDDVDLQKALAESRNSKRKPGNAWSSNLSGREKPASPTSLHSKPTSTPAVRTKGFDGPLPFERLNLGTSLLGKKKMQMREEANAGGFEKNLESKNQTQPTLLPPWFSCDMTTDIAAQRAVPEQERAAEKVRQQKDEDDELFGLDQSMLRSQDPNEAIDLEAQPRQGTEIIYVEDDEDVQEEEDQPNGKPRPDENSQSTEDVLEDDAIAEDPELRMGDLADRIRAEAPIPEENLDRKRHVAVDKSETTETIEAASMKSSTRTPRQVFPPKSDEEITDWSETDEDEPRQENVTDSAGGIFQERPLTSPSLEFDDVQMMNNTSAAAQPDDGLFEEAESRPPPTSGLVNDNLPLAVGEEEEVEVPYDDPEDDELFRQLIQEEEEHARFASSLNNRTATEPFDYEMELRQLRNQQKKDRRDADEVTQVMIQECQQLLTLFGLPYITAPMEAEAQCAELVKLGLVDGIVTDDSDVFLFGGTRVYKNVFNQAKFVECYLAQDLQAEFALTRERLVGLAQLLGSDYTEGLPGIGPVSAVELMSEFDDLNAFKSWWTEVQNGTRERSQDAGIPFRKKFRRNASKLFLPLSFPDPRVEEAYLKPEVDSDPQQFVWGIPDLNALRSFLMSTIGWSQERTDEILVPVVKDMNRRMDEGTQANITNFFGGGVGAGAFAPRRREEGKSKRLETALQRIKEKERSQVVAAGDSDAVELAAGENSDVRAEKQKGPKSRGKKRSKGIPAVRATTSEDDEEHVEPKRKRPSRRKAKA